jgi:hypothetical protein
VKSVNAKTSKRILYGVIALAFLAVAGQELAAVGLTLKAVAGGGAGLLLGFAALTGAG